MKALLRPARIDDLPALEQFSSEVGYGFTTLSNRKILAERLHASESAFHTPLEKPYHESYLFILECDGVAVGTSGLISRIGMSEPFFAYHRKSEGQLSSVLPVDRQIEVLHLIQARKKPTEISTLFISAPFRGRALGALTSLSRFLFIAAHRERFASVVIAELRGVCDSKGDTPFWDAIGRPFFDLSFPEALQLRVLYPHIIHELFPTHPIYTLLLSQAAQEVIGKTHPETTAAMKLLLKEGFQVSDYIDIFDAGPHAFAQTETIRAIRSSVVGKAMIGHKGAQFGLCSNERLSSFRSTLAHFELRGEEIVITEETAELLELKTGDRCRVLEEVK